jgi:hypothetical protein
MSGPLASTPRRFLATVTTMRSVLLLALAAVLGPTLAGCTDGRPTCAPKVVTSDQACATARDCTAAGFQGLDCIGGLCRRGCLRDDDCRLGANPDEAPECRAAGPLPAAVCEAQVCVAGCPDAPCGAGETCVAGRCLLAYEGFELRAGEDFVDLARLGFNQGVGQTLTNRTQAVAWSGRVGCDLGDERCAGPAAAGERFALLGTQPTPPRGTALEGPTCRACACCVECLLDPPSEPVDVLACPRSASLPQSFSCPASTPAVCAQVCEACEDCEAATRPQPIERLLPCEAVAASKTCSSCPACDRETAACRAEQCPACASAPNDPACSSCVRERCLGAPACRACRSCAEAVDCELSTPGSATCEALRALCEGLGPDGCFNTAVAYRREQLTDLEQALVSPPIDLSSAAGGRVVLQLDYVPFDVGLQYRPGIQGVDPREWLVGAQEMRLLLCGGGCGEPGAWRAASLVGERDPAALPPASLRDNGLTLGVQTSLDWRAGRVIFEIPPELLTRDFRYALLPRLGEGVRVGIDELRLRRLP